MGYLFTAAPAKHSRCSLPWTRGISLPSPFLTFNVGYDLNQIPYGYTVEVRNRFKGLDMIDSVPDELWTEVCDIVQEGGIETIPKKKQKGKMGV